METPLLKCPLYFTAGLEEGLDGIADMRPELPGPEGFRGQSKNRPANLSSQRALASVESMARRAESSVGGPHAAILRGWPSDEGSTLVRDPSKDRIQSSSQPCSVLRLIAEAAVQQGLAVRR